MKEVSDIGEKLTTKQRKFADEYIKSGNATQAYKLAYSTKNMSPTSINSEATKTLRKPIVKTYIDSRLKELSNSKILSAQEVLEYLSRVVAGKETEYVATSKGIFPDVPVSAKDRISAAKELLKRYPTTDPMEKQKLKKLAADARISEARAKAMEDNGADVELLLDKMMDTLAKEDLKHGSK